MSRSLLLCASIFAAAGLACSPTALAPDGGSGASGSTGIGAAGSGSTASAGVGAAGSGGAGAAGTGAADAGSAGAPGTAGQMAPHPCTKGQDAGVALVHRAQAVACKATYGDGTMTCDSSSDCTSDAGYKGTCLDHLCNFNDQCLVDADCPNGGVCTCSRWPSLLYNMCVPATCRIDADCGVDGLCAPGSSYCGLAKSYYCRSAADTCCTYEDCAGQGATTACGFSPENGHWQCIAPTMCSG